MIETNLTDQPGSLEPFPGIAECLQDLSAPIYLVRKNGAVTAVRGDRSLAVPGEEVLASVPALPIEAFGDRGFKRTYALQFAYAAGAMANGIASAEMVISLGKAGFLGSFGAAGLPPGSLEAAIQAVQAALPEGPYAFNLLSSPNDEALENAVVDRYLQYGVHVVEAAAYIEMTPALIRYRAAGLSLQPGGEIRVANRIIAKVSRKEVAQKFMEPASEAILSQLAAAGKITPQQAELARQLPVADDITIEADSGGHTDNRPLVCLLPSMLALRDELQSKHRYAEPVRIGAAGGISTPQAALAAFMMGAAYVVTGSVNQACLESGTSAHVKALLSQASLTDTSMAPSADMFEMGAKVQVLKKGTLYPMRAQKLAEIYNRYDSLEQVPAAELDKISRQFFQREIDDIWQDTVRFFNDRSPAQVEKALKNPKYKMALIFRWYLGLTSRWAIAHEKGREMDYQVWCGPSIGSFNDWARGTYLEKPENRRVVDVARQILSGAAFLYRLNMLKMQGISIAEPAARCLPRAAAG